MAPVHLYDYMFPSISRRQTDVPMVVQATIVVTRQADLAIQSTVNKISLGATYKIHTIPGGTATYRCVLVS